MSHAIVLKDHPHHFTRYEGKGTKISIFKFFSEWGKFGNQSKLFKNPNFPSLYELRKTWKYTQPQTNILKSKC